VIQVFNKAEYYNTIMAIIFESKESICVSTSILLTTLNAKYHHTAFGLRYLYANLKELQPCSKILEFTINQGAREIVEAILQHSPKVVGFGVYIWNTRQTYEVISILKKVAPDLLIVLGGPEVSYETEQQPICQLADYTLKGEADFAFYGFCKDFLSNGVLPQQKWVSNILPEIKSIQSPYSYYSQDDIKNRIIYVEASRGCPYKCEYCLSSLDKSVRNFDLDSFLADMQKLIDRGARQFKFVDRTFNLSVPTSTRILQFFLDRISVGLFLHFEMVPDRLPLELKDLIKKFPEGSLQFEIGIQTWSPEVARHVSRRQDYGKVRENFQFLTQETGVHIHADLIAGLPGETIDSFAHGFDAVSSLNPHEIQVGILKRLKGTPIIRHDQEFKMKYQDFPPFQILSTTAMDFSTLQEMNRFAHFWDLYANSGNFKNTMKLIRKFSESRESLESGESSENGKSSSFFWIFHRFSQFLHQRHPQGHGVALLNLVQSAWVYLTEHLNVDLELARETLVLDYTGYVKRDIPPFLRRPEESGSHAPARAMRHTVRQAMHRVAQQDMRQDICQASTPNPALPARQGRHLAASVE
jgi:radical SAM superfamily enzyme YgiQ (UPF0313 family)